MKIQNTTLDYIWLGFLSVLLIIIKIPHLSLPYFWDEAWPYAEAVQQMYHHGLTLLPGSMSMDISRGHPLFFHFTAALFMKLLGNSITSSHIFPLLVSLALLWTTYATGSKFLNRKTGLLAATLLLVQPVFLAQSGLLLPEMLVALLSLLTIHFYFEMRQLLFAICGTALLLTKESGAVLMAVIILYEILHRQDARQRIRPVFFLIPCLLAAIFFILQKVKTGNFFLPLHTDPGYFELKIVLKKLSSYFLYLLIYQGRNLLMLVCLAAGTILVAKKRQIAPAQKSFLFFLSFFLLAYLLFSSLTFYSPRYLLSVLPVLLLIVSMLVAEAFQKKIALMLVAALPLIAGIKYCLRRSPVNDHHLGYVDAIRVQQQVIHYCDSVNLYDKNIYAGFTMRNNLSNLSSGYLNHNKSFSHVISEITPQLQYCILSNFEFDPIAIELAKKTNVLPLKIFIENEACITIYRLTNNSDNQ